MSGYGERLTPVYAVAQRVTLHTAVVDLREEGVHVDQSPLKLGEIYVSLATKNRIVTFWKLVVITVIDVKMHQNSQCLKMSAYF